MARRAGCAPLAPAHGCTACVEEKATEQGREMEVSATAPALPTLPQLQGPDQKVPSCWLNLRLLIRLRNAKIDHTQL